MTHDLSERLFRTMLSGPAERGAALMNELVAECPVPEMIEVYLDILEQTRKAIAWDRSTETQFYIQRLPCFAQHVSFLESQGCESLLQSVVLATNAGLNSCRDLVVGLLPMWLDQHEDIGVRRIVSASLLLVRHMLRHFLDGDLGGDVADDS